MTTGMVSAAYSGICMGESFNLGLLQKGSPGGETEGLYIVMGESTSLTGTGDSFQGIFLSRHLFFLAICFHSLPSLRRAKQAIKRSWSI